MKLIGSTIRIIIFAIIAVTSLLILIFLQPVVTIDKYAEKVINKEEADTDQSDGADGETSSENWTTSTRGHKMALAVADALSPTGELEDGKVPEPILDGKDE